MWRPPLWSGRQSLSIYVWILTLSEETIQTFFALWKNLDWKIGSVMAELLLSPEFPELFPSAEMTPYSCWISTWEFLLVSAASSSGSSLHQLPSGIFGSSLEKSASLDSRGSLQQQNLEGKYVSCQKNGSGEKFTFPSWTLTDGKKAPSLSFYPPLLLPPPPPLSTTCSPSLRPH